MKITAEVTRYMVTPRKRKGVSFRVRDSKHVIQGCYGTIRNSGSGQELLATRVQVIKRHWFLSSEALQDELFKNHEDITRRPYFFLDTSEQELIDFCKKYQNSVTHRMAGDGVEIIFSAIEPVRMRG